MMNLHSVKRETRLKLYIACTFLFAGPLDYLTTYYGIYIAQTVTEANPFAQEAIKTDALFTFIIGGSLIVTALLIGTFKYVKAHSQENTWRMFEIMSLFVLAIAVAIVLNNIVQIFFI